MKGEMGRRIGYGNESFTKKITTTYKISDTIKEMGRQTGWRKSK